LVLAKCLEMHRKEKRRKSTSNIVFACNSLLFMMYKCEFTYLPEASLTKSRMSSVTTYCGKWNFGFGEGELTDTLIRTEAGY